MDRVAGITEFVVISNLENRALNAGINKAQQWWKNRHNNDNNHYPNEPINNIPTSSPNRITSPPIGVIPGQLLITILRGQDLHESRLSMISASASERPYVVIECNQQRFQTGQADSNSTNRNPQWSLNNGSFGFNIFNPDNDRLTIWIQQQDSLRVMKRNESKVLGICEINVNRLINHEQVWVPLRKDNKPVGQVLLQIAFLPKNNLSPPPPYSEFQ